MSNNKVLAKVIEDVLKGYALMFSETSSKQDIKIPEEKLIMSEIQYEGDKAGSLCVAASTSFCAEMAANILGTNENDEEAVNNEYDAINEFNNLICGHFITEYHGKNLATKILPPNIKVIDEETWSLLLEKANVVYMIDEHPLIVIAKVKST